jgi:hypothetical protein
LTAVLGVGYVAGEATMAGIKGERISVYIKFYHKVRNLGFQISH